MSAQAGKLFRTAILDSPVATAAGDVLKLDLPSENTFRTMWCFYQNDDIAATAGAQVWLRFYRNGDTTLELPAFVKPTSATFFGYAMNRGNAINSVASVDNWSTLVIGPGVIFWRNGNYSAGGDAITFALYPFEAQCEADTVKLEATHGGTGVRAYLSVLSLPASQ